jgi:ABC-type lipoprotein export system ATPase subunit
VVEHLQVLHVDGQTTVLVTHNPTVAAAAQRVVFLRDGVVVGEERGGNPDQLLARLVSLGE